MFRLLLICALLVGNPCQALAITLRYALVVGNNDGREADGSQPYPTLRHAELEATRLRENLVRYSNFPDSPTRTILLTGATRAALEEAVRILTDQKAQDLATLGKADTLFAFFFTGHGQNGRLLLNDGPLSGEALGRVFTTIAADFTVGLFDACYSGSLDPVTLAQKGISLSPGNIFRELPDEVLTAAGTIWFASSGPDQPSYEDARLGGVFTHFFLEGLKDAKVDGPGITLEQIWSYARNRTVAYTARQGRRQIPQQVVNLKSTGPLYFSFPVERSATLVLKESVEGEFLLSYADGQLSERIHKHKGEQKELAVYPGQARLLMLNSGQVYIEETLAFEPGRAVVLRSNADLSPPTQVGEANRTLWVKGLGENQLRAEAPSSESTWFLGAAYEFGSVPHGFLAAEHSLTLKLRQDRGLTVFGAWLGWGRSTDDLGDWSYSMNAWAAGISYGLGWNALPTLRLSASAFMATGSMYQKYQDGSRRDRWLFEPGAELGLLWSLTPRFALEVGLRGSAAYIPGAGQSASYHWKVRGGLEGALLFRF